MSLQNVQAQLGNLLAAMPLKLQKVQSSFLDMSTPPFEGAIASDSDGQFYVSQLNSGGQLAWQQIIDKGARDTVDGVSNSEFIGCFDLPVGFSSSTISFGKTLSGSSFSVFVQYEPPAGGDKLYVFSVSNISGNQFDLLISDEIGEEGGKIHIFARGYDAASSSGSIYSPNVLGYDGSELLGIPGFGPAEWGAVSGHQADANFTQNGETRSLRLSYSIRNVHLSFNLWDLRFQEGKIELRKNTSSNGSANTFTDFVEIGAYDTSADTITMHSGWTLTLKTDPQNINRWTVDTFGFDISE